ncbi:unnamed protein product [Didymodactylos carnosus]|uniref:RNA-dependent RNA polymerase n=2 Tax=Didymodactylos carnosus TaxID=1234261 RepID=A0A8S2I7C6_9BILA|nr:unnamed protein product [Didymodactylos carnosus]CAF3720066.1 unnamed protein product [Didymodactylos carnosus]
MQIRYNGCKGILSVKPELDNQQRQLVVRESMKKFDCDHYMLEVCKISSPSKCFCRNRQGWGKKISNSEQWSSFCASVIESLLLTNSTELTLNFNLTFHFSIEGPLYLNRQTIVLLSNRGIPDSNFLVLQNQNLLWLVQSFLDNEYALKLLNDKVLDVFPLKKLAKYIDLSTEIFFKDLLIGCCLTNVLELLK